MTDVTFAFLKFGAYALLLGLMLFVANEWIKSINNDKDDYYGK